MRRVRQSAAPTRWDSHESEMRPYIWRQPVLEHVHGIPEGDLQSATSKIDIRHRVDRTLAVVMDVGGFGDGTKFLTST